MGFSKSGYKNSYVVPLFPGRFPYRVPRLSLDGIADTFEARVFRLIRPCFLTVCMIGAALLTALAGLANSTPRAESKVVYVLPGQPTKFRLQGVDPEGNPLTFRVTGPPSAGRLAGSSPDLVYNPGAGFEGRDQLTFLVQDALGEIDIGLVEFRIAQSPAVLRAGPPGPDAGADEGLDPLATALTELGVRLWYVVAAPTLTCTEGEATPFLIAGWTTEPKVLAFGPRDRPTLVQLPRNRAKCLLDLSDLPAGSYVVAAVFGTEAVSFPATVQPRKTMTEVAFDPSHLGR